MSIMVPKYLTHAPKSTAESRIFEWFELCPGTQDWYVLYSQTEIEHQTLIVGESDFVVLSPNRGIFVLEVKGGRVSRDEGGMWHFTNKHGHEDVKDRGPFEQAKEGMFSLKKYVEKSNPALKGLLWGYGVMVPDMESFYVPNDEFSPSMVFTKSMRNRVDFFVSGLAKYNKERMKKVYNVEPKAPMPHQCKEIKELLRPVFDFAPSMASLIGDAINTQLRMTNEQFMALDAIEDNKRCLFVGGAGTGKTLVAKEIIRRAEFSNICFLCFNKNLGEWAKKDFETEQMSSKCSYVGDFHSLMVNNIKKSGLESKIDWANDNPFSESLVSLFIESLEKNPLCFDFLVIDEFQDMLDENDCFLAAFDSILGGGLERGRFAFFGDFDNQSLYHPYVSKDDAVAKLERYTSFATCKLTINCRNTPEICETITELTGVQYRKIRAEKSHLETNFIQFRTVEEEKEKLDDLLEKLKSNKGVNEDDIVILSPKSRNNSVVGLYSETAIKSLSIPKTKGVNFATIYAFKGLESPIIIMTDIDSYKNNQFQNNESLIYVGTSRAKAKLYIFETYGAAKERIKGLGN